MAKIKVCLISSCGGHFMELMQLLPIIKDQNYYIVTEKNIASIDILKEHKHYCLLQQERSGIIFLFRFAWNIILSLFFFLKENPSTIITTGAGASYPTCLIGYLFRKRIIYIESFAKLDSPSVTGKMVYPIADYFFIQWPEMKKVYPKAIYKGTVY